MKRRRIKILLGCPTYDGKRYCLDYWARCIKSLQGITPCDVLIVDNSKGKSYAKEIRKYGFNVIKTKHYSRPIKSIGESRKILYDYVLKEGYDYFFSLEQDLFPDPDILNKLLDDFKKVGINEAVIGVPYFYKSINNKERPPYETIDHVSSAAKGMVYSKKYRRRVQNTILYKELERKKGLIKVFAIGFGCCLIPSSILKKIKVRYTDNNYKTDDAFFYQDCERLDIHVYADVDLKNRIKHIPGSVAKESIGLFSWVIKKNN